MMDNLAFRQAKNHIYGLAHNISENGEAQNQLLTNLQDTEINMIAQGESNFKIISTLLTIVHDECQLIMRERE